MIINAIGNGNCVERNKERMYAVSNMSSKEIDFHLKNIKHYLNEGNLEKLTKFCESLFYESINDNTLKTLIEIFNTYSDDEQNEIFNRIKDKILENPTRGFMHNLYVIVARWKKIKAEENLKIFDSEEFGQVRTIMINNEPWFVGKDVAKILGYENQNRDIISHVDEEDRKMLNKTQYENGIKFNYKELGQRGGWIINESGLYSLMLSSKLPSAKRFKHWVTSEVLPQIRKTGGYINYNSDLTDDEILSRALTIANNTIDLKNKELREKQAEIDEMKPSVIFANAVKNINDTILVGDMARILMQNGVKTGEKRLFAWLRENGYLIKRKGSSYNMPTQYSMELELFKINYSIVNNRLVKTPRITAKGQVYFVNKFIG